MSEINIKSSTLEAAFDLLKDFLKKTIGPSADELGLMMSDNLKVRRLKNQIKNLNRVKQIVDEEGIKVKQINLKALFPYLEGVALEEDETLQEMWARMFVNYIDISKEMEVTVYPRILQQISPRDGKILLFLCNDYFGKLNIRHKQETLEYTGDNVDNLVRLGLIEEEVDYDLGEVPTVNGRKVQGIKITHSDIYYLTFFGKNFMNSCRKEELRKS